MTKVLLIGYGKIGATICDLLHDCGDFNVTVADSSSAQLARVKAGVGRLSLDVRDHNALVGALYAHDAVICAGPHDVTLSVIVAAQKTKIAYFDLTEDVRSADGAKAAAARSS